jgi:uncharacterized protein (DUF342 family)
MDQADSAQAKVPEEGGAVPDTGTAAQEAPAGMAQTPTSPPPAEAPPAAAAPARPATEASEAKEGSFGVPLELGRAVTYRENMAKGDGFMEISVAPDGMSATADLHPAKDGGLPLSMEQAEVLCARLGITTGIDWAGLSEAVIHCNLDQAVVRGFVLAKGEPPASAVVEHALLEERLRAKNEAAPEDSLRYDFRESRHLIVVRKGEVLARRVPAQAGTEGRDIRGNVLSAPRIERPSVVAGKNVAVEEDRLVSLVDGLLGPLQEGGGGRLDVEEILLVRGDVGYKTGHIIFPGDVVIEGNVEDGFKVWSGASIRCKTTLDAFDVNAKKNLLCDQGIIGKRKAQVRVGGELRAKFIQNCRVAVRGDIHVQSAIVGSYVYSLGRVELGDKGVCMGGEVFAVHGLKAWRLGNQAHQATIVHAGTDFTVQQRLDQANEKLRLLSLKAQRIREELAGRTDKAADLMLARIGQAEAETRNLIGSLLGSLDVDEGAVVEVKGEIYPGTVIDICRVSIVVDELLKSCRFHLDKAAGVIRVDRGGGRAEASKPKPPGPQAQH